MFVCCCLYQSRLLIGDGAPEVLGMSVGLDRPSVVRQQLEMEGADVRDILCARRCGCLLFVYGSSLLYASPLQ